MQIVTYKTWAPADSIWSPWAKPITFMAARDVKVDISLNEDGQNIAMNDGRTMLVFDFPGIECIVKGLEYAMLGFRPVPLFNSAPAYGMRDSSFIDVWRIGGYLFAGVSILKKINLIQEAPPVFLLDSDRYRTTLPGPGSFDNRWRLVPADMPSADFLTGHGIRKVVVMPEKIQLDLVHVLLRYKEAGIEILTVESENHTPQPADLRPPPHYKSIFHRLHTFWGLLRNTSGGFGGMIPAEDSGGFGGFGGYRGG